MKRGTLQETERYPLQTGSSYQYRSPLPLRGTEVHSCTNSPAKERNSLGAHRHVFIETIPVSVVVVVLIAGTGSDLFAGRVGDAFSGAT